MIDLEAKNQPKNFMTGSYGDNKLDKSNELNASMTIKRTEPDEYTRKIMNLGGSN